MAQYKELVDAKCANCGQELTEENIRLAIEDYNGNRHDLTFCCPDYSDETGCPGYGRDDRGKMAYWYTR